jgi:hypothetical protein
MGGTPSAWGTGAGDVPPSFQDGWIQPPAAPKLGTSLALGKTVTGSTVCATAEAAAKAVDGALANNSKWCSTVSGATLQVDLGSAQSVSSFVVKHAGLGGETTAWNTKAFTIDTSTDGSTWTNAVTAIDNAASRSYHPVAARSARYVRLTVNTPTNNGNAAARIYELEVYGGSAAPVGPVTGLAGKCVDVDHSGTANGTKVQLYTCNSSNAQQWTVAGDGSLRAMGKCADITGGGVTNNTLIQLWACNNSAAQQWVALADGSLRNPQSGKCLDVPNSTTTDGTQLQLYTCNGTAAQEWTIPT